jgi:antitoxin HicB
MKIAYPFRVTEEAEEPGTFMVQGLEPLANVVSYGDGLERALANAAEALTGVFEVMLDHGQAVPRPYRGSGQDVHLVAPQPEVIAPLVLRWAREDAKVTQSELANRLGMSYQAVQRLERPGANPTIKTMGKVARALGRQLEIRM